MTADTSSPKQPNFRGSAGHATAMLVVVTLLWGLSFPLLKRWLNSAERTDCPGGNGLAILTMIGFRSTAAVLILAFCQPRLVRAPTIREHGLGLLIGSLNFIGFA